MFMNISYLNKKISIDNNKFYFTNSNIKKIFYKGFKLVINPNNATWIVLENKMQEKIFDELCSQKKIIDIFNDNKNISRMDIEYVIFQVECKSFFQNIEIIEETHFTLRIYLTNSCNLRCKHCFMNASNCLNNELGLDELKKIIFECSQYGCNKVIFTGGEVLLNSNFDDIVIYTKKLGISTQILTNGTLWDNTRIDKMANYIDEIQISIDGFDEKSNSNIRGKNVFEKALNTVDRFINTNKTFVTVCVTPLYELMEKNYKNYILFGKEISQKYNNKNFSIIFTKEILNGRNIKSDKDKNINYLNLSQKIMEEIYENNELTNFIINHQNGKISSNCGYGNITINSNGDLYFCSRLTETKCYGNIRDLSINDIMNMKKNIQKISSVDYLKPCKDCYLKYICGGECRVSNFDGIGQLNYFEIKDIEVLKPRECSTEYKEKLYYLMIESNDFLMLHNGGL